MPSIVHWSPSDIHWILLKQYEYKPSTRDWFWNSRLSLCICRCLPNAFWCPLPLGNPIRCPYKTWAFGWWFCRCVREVTHKWHPNSSAQIQSHRPNSKTLENALVCWSIAVSWFLRINTVCSKQSSKTCSGSGRLNKILSTNKHMVRYAFFEHLCWESWCCGHGVHKLLWQGWKISF